MRVYSHIVYVCMYIIFIWYTIIKSNVTTHTSKYMYVVYSTATSKPLWPPLNIRQTSLLHLHRLRFRLLLQMCRGDTPIRLTVNNNLRQVVVSYDVPQRRSNKRNNASTWRLSRCCGCHISTYIHLYMIYLYLFMYILPLFIYHSNGVVWRTQCEKCCVGRCRRSGGKSCITYEFL